jgi:DNA polymerase III subunit delta'
VSWQTIRGHEAQKAAFAQIEARGRLAHAYLFVGPEGVGKKTFAVELARGLSCERAKAKGTLDACGECPPCVQIAAGTYPDLHSLSLPEDLQEFPINAIRGLRDEVSLKPMMGGYRIALIDDADKFSDPAANAFLKTLEEPPPHSLLILLSPSTTQLLPTIVSRCQIVRFAPLPEETVAELLLEQGLVTSPEHAQKVAAMSEGSLSQAQLLADPDVMRFHDDLLAALENPKFSGVTWADRINRFVEEAGKESAPKRQRASLVVRLLMNVLRSVLWAANQEKSETAGPPCVPFLARQLGPQRLLELLDRCLETDWMIQRRVQLVLVLEALADYLGSALRAA